MCFCIEDTEMEEEADDVALFHCALIFKYIKKWMRWYFLNSWLFIYSVFRRSAVQTEPWWVWTHSIRQQLHNNRWTDDLCHLPPSPLPQAIMHHCPISNFSPESHASCLPPSFPAETMFVWHYLVGSKTQTHQDARTSDAVWRWGFSAQNLPAYYLHDGNILWPMPGLWS